MAEQTCIYCPERFDPSLGEGDHVLPSRLFGEFEGDVRFRGACSNCNNKFGRYEQVLAQSSQLGFYRRVVNPNLGRRRNRGGLSQRGAHGNPAPRTVARFGEREFLVAPLGSDPFDVTPVDHVVITDVNGKVHHVRLFGGMTIDRLREEIERREIGKVKDIAIECNSSLSKDLIPLVQQVFSKWGFSKIHESEPGNYKVLSTMTFQYSTAYFQGLAKIAFHYYLVHNKRGFKGHEHAFKGIRQFIFNGGDPDEFFHDSDRTFAVPYGRVDSGQSLCPRDWCHVLAAMEDNGPVVVYMQLFVGPGSIPEANFVTLGNPATRVVLSQGAFGHIFKYDQQQTGRYAGMVLDAGIQTIS